MQFIDLQAQQQRIRSNIEARIHAVLDHGKYIMGPEVQELESQLASYSGAAHCITCASGTDAIFMPLMALDVGPGDAVFVPSFTFVATAEVVALTGATPVFIDCRPDTYNICIDSLREAFDALKTKEPNLKAKGIIAVDLFGQAADFDAINEFAESNNLFVIEDAAQSFGATYNGKKACSLAPIASTSFFPAKPLGCYGDGGAIFCEDDEIAAKLKSIRVHGKGTHKYDNVRIGVNGRMDTLQAAIVLEKLAIFDSELEARQRVADRYNAAFADSFVTPVVKEGRKSVWAQYTLQANNRDEVMASLKEAGIPSAIYYPKPLHQQEAFAATAVCPVSMEVSERLAGEVFSLPMHPYLSEEDQQKSLGRWCLI